MEKLERIFVGDEKGNLEVKKPTEEEKVLNAKYELAEQQKSLKAVQEEISKTHDILSKYKTLEEMCKRNIKVLESQLENK